MRAKLIELTPVSESESRVPASLNSAFTMPWQSSKVPSTAMLCTFGSCALVICRRCTSVTLPFGMQDENVDHVEAAKGLDGGGAGIAGGGADDRCPRALPPERTVHEPRHHLHGEVLEGERRPVKQLEQPARGRNLPERRDGRMMEAGIGLVEHGFEVASARIALEIGAHDAVGGLRIVEAGEGFDLGRRKTRPGFRHGEAAVAGKAREQRAFEGKRRGFAPCAHIPQD